jgi:uncharacterized membrane protein (DUF106 family)
MKKVLILAAMFGMFVACGGSNTKDVKDMTPVEKFNYYQEAMQKAGENGEYGKVEELNQEFTKWYESLSEKEAEELNVALYGEDAG